MKSVFITGAGSGMGREGGKLFYAKGWRVGAVDPNGDGPPTRSAEEIAAAAPKRGMFRLMPAASVAEVAWQAYHHPTRLHWYVPKSTRWIDRVKGLSPEMVRGRIVKYLRELLPQ